MKNNIGRSILVVVAFIGLIVASYARRAVRQSEAEQEQIRQQIDDRMHSEEFQQQIAGMAESRQQLSQQFNEILSNLPENQKAAPDVKTVRYLVYYGGVCHVDMYIFTPDLNVKKYSINPEGDKNYDYFAGELPSEDRYEVTEIKISDAQWSDIVDTLTRVNFMELK
ncbi:MAG: hypothetical protein K6G57_06485 [Lachnospiraceae bacterium]|nr:hypothetical protein [Lachnospiraceae bacterium]